MTGTMSGTTLPGRQNVQEGNGSGPGGAASPGGDNGGAGGEPGGQHLLEDKLRPPHLSFPVLARPRVTALIEQATRHRVTVISGPAGAARPSPAHRGRRMAPPGAGWSG